MGRKKRKEGRKDHPKKANAHVCELGLWTEKEHFFRFHHFFPVKVGRLKERSPLPLPPRIFREEEDREGRKKKEQIGLSDKKCLETRCHTANVRLYNGKEGGLFVLSPPSSSPHSSSSPLLIEGPPLLVNWMDLPPPCSHKTARKMGHDYCLAHMGIQWRSGGGKGSLLGAAPGDYVVLFGEQWQVSFHLEGFFFNFWYVFRVRVRQRLVLVRASLGSSVGWCQAKDVLPPSSSWMKDIRSCCDESHDKRATKRRDIRANTARLLNCSSAKKERHSLPKKSLTKLFFLIFSSS